MIGEREKIILDLLVREYIKTAEPVSSSHIARKMKGALSPASIRHVFSDLTDAGYIEQPHTSGGRVPRAQGYRFFVDQMLEGEIEPSSLPHQLTHMLYELDERIEALQKIQREVARHLRVISRFGSLMPVGFDEVFSEPEFIQEPEVSREIGRFLDEFEEYRPAYEETLLPDSFDVIIGEENGIQPMKRISVVIGKNADEELFFIAGPMRMPYDRIISLMNIWKKKPTKMKKK